MTIVSKRKLEMYVEIVTRKSKLRRMFFGPRRRPISPEEKQHLLSKYCTIQDLRVETGLSQSEFSAATFTIRKITKEKLDVMQDYNEQDDDVRQQFVEAVCERHPYFNQFEDHWPITIYTQRYLKEYIKREIYRRKQHRIVYHSANKAAHKVPDIPKRIVIGLDAIPKPSVETETRLIDPDCRSKEMQAAMGLEDTNVYRSLLKYMQNLSKTDLAHDKVFDEQDEWDWRAFVKKVYQKYPFVQQYEDHWPVDLYMKRYLESRFNTCVHEDEHQPTPFALSLQPASDEQKQAINYNPLSDKMTMQASNAVMFGSQGVCHPLLVCSSDTHTTAPFPSDEPRRCTGAQMIRAQGDVLKKFRDGGWITELQYFMLSDSLCKAVVPCA